MADVPRRLPSTPEERLNVTLDRMSPGSDLGATRFARPVAPWAGPQARAVAAPQPSGITVGITTDGAHSLALAFSSGVDNSTEADGVESVALGYGAYSPGDKVTIVGSGSSGDDSTGITAVGSGVTVHGEWSTGVGYQAGVFGARSNMYGNGRVEGDDSTAVGQGSQIQTSGGDPVNYASTLGAYTTAKANGSVAIGTNADGDGATATGENDFVLGTDQHKVSVPGLFAVHGATPVAQSATPTTLADVIAILQAHGLCA